MKNQIGHILIVVPVLLAIVLEKKTLCFAVRTLENSRYITSITAITIV